MHPSSSSSKLFQTTNVGKLKLSHRVVLAPLTRYRANKAHVHGELAVEYYTQRASVPGTLLITEGTMLAPKAGAFPNVPHVFTEVQIKEWKKVRES